MAKIEPKVPIDQTYLRRFLESNAELFAGTKTGTAIPHLDQDAMFNLEIPLPPLPEQKRIVRLLDEAFEEIAIAKANTEKNLQNARALFQSSLQSQFRQGPDESHGASASKNMKLLALADYCDDYRQDIVDGPFGSNLKREDYLSAGIPVLKIQNIKPMTVEVKKMDYVSVEKFRGLQRHSFRIGDIVMTKLGDPLGVSAVVEDIEQGVIVADLVRIRASKINTKFLCYQLNAPIVKKLINAMQKGTTRPRVTLSVVRSLPIYAPSAVEQLKVVSILDKMSSSTNELIEVYLRKFKDLDLLKAALLRETFSGGGKTA
jgi:type I restriction enzyme S subunit